VLAPIDGIKSKLLQGLDVAHLDEERKLDSEQGSGRVGGHAADYMSTCR
jgi:hypothetical protein